MHQDIIIPGNELVEFLRIPLLLLENNEKVEIPSEEHIEYEKS